jgi:hypothetical protein
MTTCPSCGGQAMSAFTKSFIGPARAVPCQSCGVRLGVPWKALWLTLPLIVIALAALMTLGAIAFAVIVPLGLLSNYLTYRYIPLIAREAARTPAP